MNKIYAQKSLDQVPTGTIKRMLKECEQQLEAYKNSPSCCRLCKYPCNDCVWAIFCGHCTYHMVEKVLHIEDDDFAWWKVKSNILPFARTIRINMLERWIMDLKSELWWRKYQKEEGK